VDEEQWERLRQGFERAGLSPAEAEAVLTDLAWVLIRRRREKDALQRELEEALMQVLDEELPEDPKDRVAAIAAILVARLERGWWFR